MITPESVFQELQEHFDAIVLQETEHAKAVWHALLQIHPADISLFLTNFDREQCKQLFNLFPGVLQQEVFEHFSDSLKAFVLSFVGDELRTQMLNKMSMDEITDLADFATSDEFRRYMALLRRQDREKVLSMLKLGPSSVGAVMNINVVSLQEDFLVEKAIRILQRLKPEQELHQIIYITDRHNRLVGYIKLEDLVLNSSKTHLMTFLRKNELVAKADEDQEEIAKKMRHYQLTTVPVVSPHNYFLGVIPPDTFVDILEEEASEDVLRISAMSAIRHSYLETPFFKIFVERTGILLALMFVESLTSIILETHHALLAVGGLFAFSTMLISTGGNTSSQTSAVVIQGLASGEINESNVHRFFRREMAIGIILAIFLGIGAFIRLYFLGHKPFTISAAVGGSALVIVFMSVLLGSTTPFVLKKNRT